eukprot:scaffold1804_cov93-Isochrysis_galbana.AAC.3
MAPDLSASNRAKARRRRRRAGVAREEGWHEGWLPRRVSGLFCGWSSRGPRRRQSAANSEKESLPSASASAALNISRLAWWSSGSSSPVARRAVYNSRLEIVPEAS